MFKHSLFPVSWNKSLEPLRGLGRDLEKFKKSFFNGWGVAPSAPMLPNIDVIEDDKVIKVIADLPGLEEKDIKIEINDGVLKVTIPKLANNDAQKKRIEIKQI